MPCFHPLIGYKRPSTGQWISEKYAPLNHNMEPLTIPCNKCTGCRSEYSRQWAMRIKHEYDWQQKLGRNSTFITLTYNEKNLPSVGSLEKKDFQLFMKRLRKLKKSNKSNPLRFYACGEYGDRSNRPHYHAILFNCTFKKDAEIANKGKDKLYYSQELQDVWSNLIKKPNTYEPIGFASWGTVTFESAQYVAGYVQKKINGKQKDEHYKRYVSPDEYGELQLDKNSNEEFQLQQEFSLMSRKPGIASDWLTAYKDDIYPSDFITINGRKMRPPLYYDRQYQRTHADEMEAIKEIRKQKAIETEHLRTPEVLAYLEQKHKARMSLYKRGKL